MDYEAEYENVTEVAGLDIIAVEGKGLYASDGEYTWLLATEDYMQALPALEAQYPYDIDQ
jgi:hypothetical protein